MSSPLTRLNRSIYFNDTRHEDTLIVKVFTAIIDMHVGGAAGKSWFLISLKANSNK